MEPQEFCESKQDKYLVSESWGALVFFRMSGEQADSFGD